MMAGIRGKNTRPELVVRRGLHAAGFRFRLHDRRLPGRPDLVFPRYRAAVFVHGCFWHGHGCHLFKWPQSRERFWREKILGNVQRDRAHVERLQQMDWRVLTIWECAIKGATRIGGDQVIEGAATWLRSSAATGEIKGAQRGLGGFNRLAR